MRPLQGNLSLRPWFFDWVIARSIHQGLGLRFPCHDWTVEVNELFIIIKYGLFIMDLSLQSIKTIKWSADNFKKTCHPNELYTWACDTVRWHWSTGTLFDSCQLTITWQSIVNTVCICFGHIASDAWSLLENSQSEGTYYCSHIIKCHILSPNWHYYFFDFRGDIWHLVLW